MSRIAKKMPQVMVVLEMSNKINRDRMQGILRYERLYGPWRLHLLEGKRVEQPSHDLRVLGVDGVIASMTLEEAFGPISRARLPTVLFDPPKVWNTHLCPPFRFSRVCCDPFAVGRMGADYLHSQGFSSFAFVADAWDSSWAMERCEGFVRQVKRAGGVCRVYRGVQEAERNDWTLERPKLATWLADLPKPVGVMAASDMRGRQVLDACAVVGVRVPDQAAVLGVDNDELICATTNPPMSSILRDTEGGGYAAARLLDAWMRGRSRGGGEARYGPIRVIARSSTEQLQFGDPLAVRAVAFIRLNGGRLGVGAVIRHLRVSRRLAELRFRQAVGRSIHDELQRARLTQVRRLLLETDLPLSRVAEQAGYANESYLGQVFKRQFGVTPLRFRKARGKQD